MCNAHPFLYLIYLLSSLFCTFCGCCAFVFGASSTAESFQLIYTIDNFVSANINDAQSIASRAAWGGLSVTSDFIDIPQIPTLGMPTVSPTSSLGAAPVIARDIASRASVIHLRTHVQFYFSLINTIARAL